MSKTMQWVIGILAALGVAGLVIFLILWMKEKKKNEGVTTTLPGGSTVTVSPQTATATEAAVTSAAIAERKAKTAASSYKS